MRVYFAGVTRPAYTPVLEDGSEGEEVPATLDLVGTSDGRPYLYVDADKATAAFKLMRHHSSLYYSDDGKTAKLVERGQPAREWLGPASLTLPPGAVCQLEQSFREGIRY